MAIKPGRPVAMGMIAGAPLIGLPGNPVASFVTFVHVVRPTMLALAGATPQPLSDAGRDRPSPQEESRPPRICPCQIAQGRRRRARSEEISARRRGILSSLVETDGLVELGEEITKVEPGQIVGFL